jgi:hypothetical protein
VFILLSTPAWSYQATPSLSLVADRIRADLSQLKTVRESTINALFKYVRSRSDPNPPPFDITDKHQRFWIDYVDYYIEKGVSMSGGARNYIERKKGQMDFTRYTLRANVLIKSDRGTVFASVSDDIPVGALALIATVKPSIEILVNGAYVERVSYNDADVDVRYALKATPFDAARWFAPDNSSCIDNIWRQWFAANEQRQMAFMWWRRTSRDGTTDPHWLCWKEIEGLASGDIVVEHVNSLADWDRIKELAGPLKANRMPERYGPSKYILYDKKFYIRDPQVYPDVDAVPEEPIQEPVREPVQAPKQARAPPSLAASRAKRQKKTESEPEGK